MALRPVSNVSAGEALRVGRASIDNKAVAITTHGWSSLLLASPMVVDNLKYSQANISPDLIIPIGSYNAQSIRFVFLGAIVQPRVTLGVQSKYGVVALTYGARKITAAGIAPPILPTPLVSSYRLDGYDINLKNSLTPTNSQNIPMHFGGIVISNLSAGDSAEFGTALLVKAFNARPIPIDSLTMPAPLTYSKLGGVGNLSLDLIRNASSSEPIVRLNFGGADLITQAGNIHLEKFGFSKAKVAAPSLKPKSISSTLVFRSPIVYEKDPYEIHKTYGALDLDLSRSAAITNALNIGFYFWADNQVSPSSFESSNVAIPDICNFTSVINLQHWQSSSWGGASIVNTRLAIYPSGITPTTQLGILRTINKAESVVVLGISPPLFLAPLTYNLKQYAPLQGRDQSLYGSAYLQGGVRWLNTGAWQSSAFGGQELVNTTANQLISIAGMAPMVMPSPIVLPRMIYPASIYQGAVGVAIVIPTPVIKPKGGAHTQAGSTSIWYHTRPLVIDSINAYESGHPKVFDPTRFMQPSPMVRSTVFGDTYIKSTRSFITINSIDDMVVSEWVSATNKNNPLSPKGILPRGFGTGFITNKTPSLFFKGFAPPIFYSQSIGYRIRSVYATGFDLLVFGDPTLIKTPELFPTSFASSTTSKPVISNNIRYLRVGGIDSFTVGDAQLWFWQRPIEPYGWVSPTYSAQDITHSVRLIIGHGFTYGQHGVQWISRGTRLLEPESVYKEFQSSHYVGRHQEIKPQGYIATLFGTRIIPNNIDIYPTGFAEVWGLISAHLVTQYIKPSGYISVGQQPADRWGDSGFYNLRQYIRQDFAGDNGLVPPAWSDWTLIENRNKQIGAISTNTLRFGYSVIANNATSLLPVGVIPPAGSRNDVSMIAYRIRHVAMDGIEPPHISSWGVVYNAARVLLPLGVYSTSAGLPAVVSTRRHYRSVGRIESFESGTAMIAYRIRTIDIETRYTISPPRINLPIADLWTRYVSYRGYESAAYGLPSLSIHLRVIAPRWSYRDKGGNPILKNVTPELYVNGHDSNEFGVVSARTQWRTVTTLGDTATLFGLSKISDSKQSILVRGWRDTAAGQFHKLVKTGTNPYVTQNIFLNNESGHADADGYGIYFDTRVYGQQIPNPYLNQNVLYHKGGSFSSYGTAFVWTNNIIVTGFAIENILPSTTVHNYIRFLKPVSLVGNIEVGKPRLSPHTIWAVMDAPQQAKDNHTGNNLHYVGDTGNGEVGAKLGLLHIGTLLRSISINGFNNSNGGFGRASLVLKKRFLFCESFRRGRFGVPEIPFTLKVVGIRNGIYSQEAGRPEVIRGLYTGSQYINPEPLEPPEVTVRKVENQHNILFAVGKNQLEMGTRKFDDNPYMWQGLRVGAHTPTAITAGVTTLHGSTVIQLWVREVAVVGFGALGIGYDISNFSGRMKIARASQDVTGSYIAISNGYQGSLVSEPGIKLNQHFIRPDGNSDQFRKGGYHA